MGEATYESEIMCAEKLLTIRVSHVLHHLLHHFGILHHILDVFLHCCGQTRAHGVRKWRYGKTCNQKWSGHTPRHSHLLCGLCIIACAICIMDGSFKPYLRMDPDYFPRHSSSSVGPMSSSSPFYAAASFALASVRYLLDAAFSGSNRSEAL